MPLLNPPVRFQYVWFVKHTGVAAPSTSASNTMASLPSSLSEYDTVADSDPG